MWPKQATVALLAYKKGGEQWCLIMVGEEGGQARLEKIGSSMHDSLSNIAPWVGDWCYCRLGPVPVPVPVPVCGQHISTTLLRGAMFVPKRATLTLISKSEG